MPPEDIIWTEQEEFLSVWCSSEEAVLVIGEYHGERQYVVAEKRAVLEGVLSKAAKKYSEKFPSTDPAFESFKKDNEKLASENQRLKKNLKEITGRIEAVERQLSELVLSCIN